MSNETLDKNVHVQSPGTISQEITHGPVDSAGASVVQVVISKDRKKIWINVDDRCWFRATRIGELDMVDLGSRGLDCSKDNNSGNHQDG